MRAMKLMPATAALVVAVIVLVASCSDRPAPTPPKVAKPPGPAFVSSTVTLPGGDGRVHIVAIPGRYETAECAVLVAPSGSSISCPNQVDLGTDSHVPSVLDGASDHQP